MEVINHSTRCQCWKCQEAKSTERPTEETNSSILDDFGWSFKRFMYNRFGVNPYS